MAINELSESSAIAEFGELESGGEKVEKSHLDTNQRAIESSSGQHIHALERYITLSSVVNFGFIMLASWESFATSFQFALLNGGPASMFYGGILACLGECAVGLSLAELASIDPTVGAQYRWSANLAPIYPRFWGLVQGWITVFAWCFACGGPPSLISTIITSLAIFNDESYVPERWHTSLIMIATLIVPFIFNLWFRKILDGFEIFGGLLHICLFVVFIAILTSLGTRGSSDYVFETLTWDSGWNNKGVSFGLGMLPATFSLTGCDSVLHMSDEVKKVNTRVPRSMILACVVNSVFLMAFIIVLLFFIGPLDAIPESAPLPLIYVLYSATGSKQATNTLVALIAILYFVRLFNVFASVSRLIWVFAKDNGLPFSNTFTHVHPTLKLPVNALAFVAVIIICLSLIYIGSATAFNALISLQTLALHVSYFFPILFMLIRRIRGPPPPYGSFKLGAFGVPLNVLSLSFLAYVAMWMPFPQMLPVTKDNMNYAGPIFGAVVVGGFDTVLTVVPRHFIRHFSETIYLRANMLPRIFRVGLQAVIFYGAFSRFTHGRYTSAFHEYQAARAPNNEYTQSISIFDVVFATLFFSARARPWTALLCAIAQGGGVIKLVQEGKDVTPDVGLFMLAMAVFLTSWFRGGKRETSK